MKDHGILADLLEGAQIEISYWDGKVSRAVDRPLLESEKAMLVASLRKVPTTLPRNAVAARVQSILAVELGIDSHREIVGTGPASYKIADLLHLPRDAERETIERCANIAAQAAKRCVRERIPGDSVAAFIERAILALPSIPPREGPIQSTTEQADASRDHPVRENCAWPDAPFTFHDEPGEHDPCYVVMPGGAMLSLNHHASEGVDIARAKFIVAACNAALQGQLPFSPAHLQVIVTEAMLDSWNDICSDTGCHPLDIEQVGKRRLEFHVGHWARQTGTRVAQALSPSPTSDEGKQK